MESSGLVETEDTVQALVDHLVYPLLPARFSPEWPTLSQQEAVGKQLHAVVLLYNYYHRKQFRQLEFLEFEFFCKLAVIAKSSLVMYMQFMREANGPERELSVTEKMVVDACSICAGLDASKDAPYFEEWPVSKVAVFLIDSTKKNCLLQFCSTVQGVWSPIEKDIVTPSDNKVEATKNFVTSKEKRTVNGFSQDGFLPREDKLLQLAFSAVEEKTGIKKADITVLEQHMAYSLSRENSTAQFYLMQYTEKFNDEMIVTPIEDVVNSLQGPLVRKALTTEVTAVVDYFHLLPYFDILTKWLYRERHANGLSPSRACRANVESNGYLEPVQILAMKDRENDRSLNGGQTTDILNTETSTSEKEIKNKREHGPCSMNTLSGNVSEPQNMGNGSLQSILLQPLATRDKIKSVDAVTAEKHIGKRKNASTKSEVFAENTSVDKKDILQSIKNPRGEESIGTKPLGRSDTRNTDYPVQDGVRTSGLTLVPHQFSPLTRNNFQVLLESKKNDLLQTSLRVLQKKLDELHQQQHLLEDEIARCEMNRQTILSEGEGSLTLKIDSIIEACNNLCSNQTHVGTYKRSGDRSPLRDIKKRRLSEAILSLRSPCQDLDEICNVNNWILPKYSVLPSVAEGGFKANVTVKGMDFECTGGGDLRGSPQDARESAAGHMLSKLRTMANQFADS